MARARITIPDLVHLLYAFAFLAALYPVFWTLLEGAPTLGTGELYLLQLVLPTALLVLLWVLFAKAGGGAT
jgi:hypothetical protein